MRTDETIREQPAAAGEQGVAERLRDAIRQQLARMTLQLAREFGVPEVEVSRGNMLDYEPKPDRTVCRDCDE